MYAPYGAWRVWRRALAVASVSKSPTSANAATESNTQGSWLPMTYGSPVRARRRISDGHSLASGRLQTVEGDRINFIRAGVRAHLFE